MTSGWSYSVSPTGGQNVLGRNGSAISRSRTLSHGARLGSSKAEGTSGSEARGCQDEWEGLR